MIENVGLKWNCPYMRCTIEKERCQGPSDWMSELQGN